MSSRATQDFGCSNKMLLSIFKGCGRVEETSDRVLGPVQALLKDQKVSACHAGTRVLET